MANDQNSNDAGAADNFGGSVGSQPSVAWDESKMQENYANVATISATREEVSLLFGTQRGWRPDPSDVAIQLTNRIILNPYLAKRFLGVLSRTVDEYEKRYGSIDV